MVVRSLWQVAQFKPLAAVLVDVERLLFQEERQTNRRVTFGARGRHNAAIFFTIPMTERLFRTSKVTVVNAVHCAHVDGCQREPC